MITQPEFKVLIVDDEVSLASAIAAMVESLGYRTYQASSAQSAIEIIKENTVDAVISDVKLPDLSGIDLKRKVNKIFPEIPFIFMSGFADIEMVIEATKEGAEGFLLKPFEFRELRDLLLKIFEKERIRRENIQLKRLIELFTVVRRIIEPRDFTKTVSRLKECLIEILDADTVSFVPVQEEEIIFDYLEGTEIECCQKIVEYLISNFSPDDEQIKIYKSKELPFVEEEGYSCVISYVSKNDETGKVEFIVMAGRSIGEPEYKEIDITTFGIICSQFEIVYYNRKYLAELESAYLEMIESLSKTLEARDVYTGGHTCSVEEICMVIADRLSLSVHEKKILRLAARLHDIGKVGIPDNILLKPGKLTEEEYEIIKKHPVIGYEILSKSVRLKEVAEIVLYHHEWYSGGGYPFGMKGEDIPFLSRILCLADAFHALVSDRPYRKAFSVEKAMEIIREETPLKFDPKLVDILSEMVDSEKLRFTDYDLGKNT
jgi:putative nucleotidyltransferase with HDIG domain